MVLLAGLRPYGVFLDPFCGVGTIGIEAARLQSELSPTVSDIDASMVALARANGKSIRRMNFVVTDAGQLPFGYRSVDRVVCNLPWGRTVKQQGTLSSATMPFWREMGRILHSESRAVVLCEDVEPTDDQLRGAGLCLVLRNKISVFGRWPTLSVLVSDSQRNPTPIDEYGKFGDELEKQLGQGN
jgi:23S rRNA G2445 N2-methylase RlmL